MSDNYILEPYDNALQSILKDGIHKADRTGVGCISLAGIQCHYNLENNILPIVTGRKLFPKSVIAELLWFISGSTYNQDLERLGCKFWSKWCDPENIDYQLLSKRYNYKPGDFGPIYGYQLRNFGGKYPCRSSEFDQLKWMMDILKKDPFGPDGRRCLFSLWNPCDLHMMTLPPCHFCYQVVINGDMSITGILTQRSCDSFVGVPYNIVFYSLLTRMIAFQSNMKAKSFIHNMNDAHIYINHLEEVKEYLGREKPNNPIIKINHAKDIFSYQMADFTIENYTPKDLIKAQINV